MDMWEYSIQKDPSENELADMGLCGWEICGAGAEKYQKTFRGSSWESIRPVVYLKRRLPRE
jgi:hypothetical protein